MAILAGFLAAYIVGQMWYLACLEEAEAGKVTGGPPGSAGGR